MLSFSLTIDMQASSVSSETELKGNSNVQGVVILTQEEGGAHFNPNNVTHGTPEDETWHVRKLGNIIANADS
ncbi:hypothetical protein SAY87_016278 [Trapa incisa]|uniref:Uncharacterized protein n=1 Tax=Trapa incisa TaxID=236973 RepID=A0AAN7LH61_9MYRT|nr:hypothetical protein SAY87_016278 [Trapa incisa]